MWISVVVAHGLSCSTARGIFLDQGLNPCPLQWQADSYPLRHLGSPVVTKTATFTRQDCESWSTVLFICLFLAVLGLWLCGLFPGCGEQGCFPVQCEGFSLRWLLLWSTGPRALGLQWLRCVGPVVGVPGLSYSTACGIFLDQGLNLWLPNWQADSSPLRRQESPVKKARSK